MLTILLATLLAGLPEVVIADEPRVGTPYRAADPSEIKVSVTNKSDGPITAFFGPMGYEYCFKFHFFDEQGRPVVLARRRRPRSGPKKRVEIKPGETSADYLAPARDLQVPPGRYQVEVVFLESGGSVDREVRSNRITKTFP
jgi:hypothetical protein